MYDHIFSCKSVTKGSISKYICRVHSSSSHYNVLANLVKLQAIPTKKKDFIAAFVCIYFVDLVDIS